MNVNYNRDFLQVINKVRVEVLEAGLADLDNKWRHQDECSPYSRLYYVISGRGYLRIRSGARRGELITMNPGYLYLIPNGLSYDYFCDHRLEKVYVHINVWLQNGLELFGGYNNVCELPQEQEHLEELRHRMTGRKPEDFFCLQGEIYHAIAALMEPTGVGEKLGKKYSEVLIRCFELLPGMKIAVTIREISKMLNLSESTLAKQFKKETGMSIGKYREQLIMDRARQLLAIGEKSVGEIAEEVGFGDQFYFAKYFKQRQGMRPGEYKKYYKEQKP